MTVPTRVAVACLLWPVASLAGAKPYSIEDLVALDKAGSHQELLDHAEDVAPASRDARWQGLVEKAAAQSVAGPDAIQALTATESLLKRYSFLKKSSVFAPARSAATLKGIGACYDARKYDDCAARAVALIDGDRALALQVGKLVTRKQFVYFAVPMFRKAAEGGYDKKICEDDDLLRSVAAALELPKDHEMLPDARDITSKFCFAEVLDTIEAKVRASTPDSYLAQNTCDLLKAKGALAKLKPNPCTP